MTERPVENESDSASRSSKLPSIPKDRYTVISELGRGGMGVVLKARHASLNKLVAIKVLNASMLADEAGLKRFEVEAKAGSQLSHPNLVSVFDYGFTEDREPYLVMEYIEGDSLDDYLDRFDKVDKVTFIKIFEQVLKGLQYVHNHDIIHRDLKTSNIMTEIIDGELYAKLLDFGVAKVLVNSGLTMHNLTETGAAFGSPLYMSPEQCMGLDVDARSDIYSLGCVMYQCIVGLPPIIGANPLQTIHMQVNGDEPDPIECDENDSAMKRIALLIQRCLRKAPKDRFQNAQELLIEIQSIKEEMNAERYQSIPPSQPMVPVSDETLKLESKVKLKVEEKDSMPEASSPELASQAIKNTSSSNPWGKVARSNSESTEAQSENSITSDSESGISERDLELRQITTQSLRKKDIYPTEEVKSGSSLLKKLTLASLVVCIGIGAAFFAINYIENENNSFEKAEAKFKEGIKSWPEAEAIYIKLLAKGDTKGNSGIINERLGEIHQANNLDEAEVNFRAALDALDTKEPGQIPYAAKSMLGLANILISRKQFDEAKEYLEQADRLASGQDDFELKGDVKLGLAKCTAGNTESHDGVKNFDEAISEYAKLSDPPAEKLASAWVESAEFCNKIKWESEVPRRAKRALEAAEKIKLAQFKDEILRRAEPLADLEKKVLPPQQAQAATQPEVVVDTSSSQLSLEESKGANALKQAQLNEAKRGQELSDEFSKFRKKQFEKTTRMLKDMSNSAQSVDGYAEDGRSMESLKKLSEEFVAR